MNDQTIPGIPIPADEPKIPHWKTIAVTDEKHDVRRNEQGEPLYDIAERKFSDGSYLRTEGRGSLERVTFQISVDSARKFLTDNGFDFSRLEKALSEDQRNLGDKLDIQYSPHPHNLYVNGLRVEQPSLGDPVETLIYFFVKLLKTTPRKSSEN